MRALTVTHESIIPGIQATTVEDGTIVELGTPKHSDAPQPYVMLSPNNPPDVDDTGLIHDADLVQISHSRAITTGFLGWILTKPQEQPSGELLIRSYIPEIPGSVAQPVMKVGRKIDVKGRGYTDFKDIQQSGWVDILHRLYPGEGIHLRTDLAEYAELLDRVLVNVGDELLQFSASDIKGGNEERKHARRYIYAITDAQGDISPNAYPEKVQAALDALIADPSLKHWTHFSKG
jgi:hypothetical protein